MRTSVIKWIVLWLFMILLVEVSCFLGSIIGKLNVIAPSIAFITVTVLCIIGCIFSTGAYTSGIKYGHSHILLMEELEVGKIYQIWFKFPAPDDNSYVWVFLYQLDNMDIANPDRCCANAKGLMRLRIGDTPSYVVEIDKGVENRDRVTLRRYYNARVGADHLYLAKWLDEKTLAMIK